MHFLVMMIKKKRKKMKVRGIQQRNIIRLKLALAGHIKQLSSMKKVMNPFIQILIQLSKTQP